MLSLLLAALLADPALHVQRVNTFTSSSQDAVALDEDARGRALVTWQSRRQQGGTYGVYARLYDADGSPLTDEVQLNSHTQSHQESPSVALDAEGAWAAWTSYLQDGDYGAVVARRFDTRLRAATPEFVVHEDGAGDQGQVVLAGDAAGRALVVWTSSPDAEAPRHLFGRALGENGEPLGASFRIDSGAETFVQRPSIALGEGGEALVVWSATTDGATPAGILGRRVSLTEGPLGETLNLSGSESGQAIEPVIATRGEERFVLAWLELRGGAWTPTVRTLEWTEEGLSAGATRTLATPKRGYVSGLALDGGPAGDFVLAWNRIDARCEARGDVLVQRFDSSATAIGAARLVTRDAAGEQRLSQADGRRKLAYLDEDRVLVGWSGDAGLGDDKGAHLSWLGLEGPALGAATEREDERPTPAPHDPPTFDPNHPTAPLSLWMAFNGATGAFGFETITDTGWNPPDPSLAVGPEHVVQVSNGGVAFYGKDGSFQFQDQLEGAAGFFGSVGATNFVFDPETVFDPHSRRFLISACERSPFSVPYLLLAVSDDADPNGTWHKYRIDVQSAAGDTDIDSQSLGVDSQAVYLTADFFGPDKLLVAVLDKSPLLSGGAPQTGFTVLTGRQSLGVPVNHDANSPEVLVWSREFGTATELTLYAVQGPPTNPTLVSADVTVPAYTQPEDAPQGGTSVRFELFESRFWSCTQRHGSLWATHHVGDSRALQRWYEIDLGDWPASGSPTLVQSGEIDPGGNGRTYFGSIGVDGEGNMALVYAQSSPSDLVEMRYVHRRASDPLGQTSASELAQASSATDVSGRWGDYSSAVPDPDDVRVFWGCHEFFTGVWRSWTQRFLLCGPPRHYCTTSANSVGAGAQIDTSGTVSIAANDLTLLASGAAPNQAGIFYYGQSRLSLPFGDGVRCVGGTTWRLPVIFADGQGQASYTVDYGAITQVSAQLHAGDQRHFQFWYRDPAAGGSGFNLSDALTILFCP